MKSDYPRKFTLKDWVFAIGFAVILVGLMLIIGTLALRVIPLAIKPSDDPALACNCTEQLDQIENVTRAVQPEQSESVLRDICISDR